MTDPTKILIVNTFVQADGRRKNHTLFSKSLNAIKRKYKPTIIFDVDEAIARITAPEEDYDVIIVFQSQSHPTDWKKILTTLKMGKYQCELIAVTDEKAESGVEAVDALKLGAFAYFSSPFVVDVLIGYIDIAYKRKLENKVRSEFSGKIIAAPTSEAIAGLLDGQLKVLLDHDGSQMVFLNASNILKGSYTDVDFSGKLYRTLFYSNPPLSNWKILGPVEKGSLIETIILEGKPFICPDIRKEPQLRWLNDHLTKPKDHKIRSWMAIPIMLGETPIGLVTLDSRHTNQFSYENIPLGVVQDIVNQAAVAFTKTERQEAERRLEKAQKIVFGTNTLESIFTSIAEQAGELVGGIFSYVVQPDDPQVATKLQPVAGWSQHKKGSVLKDLIIDLEFHINEPDKNYVPGKKGITTLAYEQRRPCFVSDIQKKTGAEEEDPEAYEAYLGYIPEGEVETGSDLAVPIIDGDDVYGVINVEHKYPYAFTAEHLHTMQRFAEFVAIAIRLNSVQNFATDTNRILDHLAKAALFYRPKREREPEYNYSDFLNEIANQVSKLTAAKWATLYTLNDDRPNNYGVSKTTPGGVMPIKDKNNDEVLRGDERATTWIAKSRNYLIIKNVDHYGNDPDQDDIGVIPLNPTILEPEHGVKALLGLPVTLFEQEVGGVIWVYFDRVMSFDKLFRDTLKEYARHIAIYLRDAENFYMLRAFHDSLKTMFEVRSINLVAQKILHAGLDIVGTRHRGGVIYRNDPANSVLRMEYLHPDLPEQVFRQIVPYGAATPESEKGMGGRLIDSDNDSMYIPDYDAWPGHIHPKGVLGSVLAIKLKSPVDAIPMGLIVFNTSIGYKYDSQLEILKEFARHASAHWELVSQLEKSNDLQDIIDPNKVFVIMWFDGDMYGAYASIKSVLSETFGLDVTRADDPIPSSTYSITPKMLAEIKSSRYIIVLLKGGRPNVYLELGYSLGLDEAGRIFGHRKEIVICAARGSTNEDVHFDIKDYRMIQYDKVDDLKLRIKDEFGRIINGK